MGIYIMNKINPIYILLISFSLFLYSFYSLQISKENVKQAQIENKNYIKLANEYQALQKAWDNGKNVDKKIKNILNRLNIKDTKIQTDEKAILYPNHINSNNRAQSLYPGFCFTDTGL
jgi:hypothetical protein